MRLVRGKISAMSRRITVAEMAPHVHGFLPNENKVKKLAAWLSNWIKTGLESQKIEPEDLLPSKGDLACHIGVSQGTVQSAYRMVEDMGLVESKQRIGTYIKNSAKTMEKLTSKRELAIEIVKKFLSENNYKIGDKITSVRELSRITGISNTTLVTAFSNLVSQGILEKKNNSFIMLVSELKIQEIETKTLVEKVAESIKAFALNLSAGDKLPPNKELAKKFNVSVKTIHDAIKLLSKEGLLHTRRGKYGTSVSQDNAELYHYEKIEQKIRQYIIENAQVGDKLPSIKEFASLYNISEKTVKKALDNLAEDGYLTFTRGRYGGTFVMDIPQGVNEAYKWLAINSEYIFPE